MPINCIVPKWDAPSSVKAFFTLRDGGVSRAPFSSLNMSASAGDDINAVCQNRRLVDGRLPSSAKWLRQMHTARVVCAGDIGESDEVIADGIWTVEKDAICAVMVADCAPVLMATADGMAVAAVHCGWRGLSAGVVENAAAKLRAASSSPIVAWVGPAICAGCYPVGGEVRAAFGADDAGCFVDIDGRLCADIGGLAKRRLMAAGAASAVVYGECTFENGDKYFSARRDGNKTGRMAAVIWRE